MGGPACAVAISECGRRKNGGSLHQVRIIFVASQDADNYSRVPSQEKKPATQSTGKVMACGERYNHKYSINDKY